MKTHRTVNGLAPWIIVHVPHSTRAVPSDCRRNLLLSDHELELELDRLTDHHSAELFTFDLPEAAVCSFPVSRLVLDPERFENDAMEPMAERGMGVIYTRTSNGRPLRHPPSTREREHLLDRFYRPHHRQLKALVTAALETHGRALIIDAHSFPNHPLPCDLDQSRPRPDICLGTDRFHTPTRLIRAIKDECMQAGFTVQLNRPYAGTLVPVPFLNRDAGVHSVMVEVNRRLYLRDEPRDVRLNAEFWHVRDLLRRLVVLASIHHTEEHSHENRATLER